MVFIEVDTLSRVRLFVTPQTVVCRASLFMGFSWHKYWHGFPFPLPGDLSGPGIKTVSPVSPASQVDSLPLSHWGWQEG